MPDTFAVKYKGKLIEYVRGPAIQILEKINPYSLNELKEEIKNYIVGSDDEEVLADIIFIMNQNFDVLPQVIGRETSVSMFPNCILDLDEE